MKAGLLTLAVICSACGARQPAPEPSELSVPLGPLPGESGLVEAAGRSIGGLGMSAALGGLSQTGLAAVAPTEFRLAVETGDVRRIQTVCLALNRITHEGLTSESTAAVAGACARLAGAEPGSSSRCDSQRLARRALALLVEPDERPARRALALALRQAVKCGQAPQIARARISPKSRGFLVVAALALVGAPPESWAAPVRGDVHSEVLARWRRVCELVGVTES